jgi:hypothetical protein
MRAARTDKSTLWVRKDTLAVLKQVMLVLGAENLDETVGRLVDHFRSCPKGLHPKLREMQRRMEGLKSVRRSQ